MIHGPAEEAASRPPHRGGRRPDDRRAAEATQRRCQTVKDAASGLLSAPRKREAKRGEVKERMRTEELGVAYGGKPAVKGVNLTVNQGEVLA